MKNDLDHPHSGNNPRHSCLCMIATPCFGLPFLSLPQCLILTLSDSRGGQRTDTGLAGMSTKGFLEQIYLVAQTPRW